MRVMALPRRRRLLLITPWASSSMAAGGRCDSLGAKVRPPRVVPVGQLELHIRNHGGDATSSFDKLCRLIKMQVENQKFLVSRNNEKNFIKPTSRVT
jgi:hypothetical protein